MFDKTRQAFFLIFAVYSFLHISNVNAVDLGGFGSSIFRFQVKMAAKGNTQAEYKLGTLYEFGVSVEPNITEANKYYKKAAVKGYRPAINRLTYLEIKQSGYNKKKHDEWFKKLKNEVASSEPNSLILLGQMHKYGINVNKNINTALAMLQKASALGHTEIDSEIDELYREIEARNELKRKLELQQAEEEKTKLAVSKKSSAKKVVKPKQKPKKLSAEEKHLKYVEAMKKLNQDELILQQQQEWSENE